jgi:hypothetical protein
VGEGITVAEAAVVEEVGMAATGMAAVVAAIVDAIVDAIVNATMTTNRTRNGSLTGCSVTAGVARRPTTTDTQKLPFGGRTGKQHMSCRQQCRRYHRATRQLVMERQRLFRTSLRMPPQRPQML